MRSIILTLAALPALLPATLLAQPPELRLADVVDEALASNPELQAAHARATAAAAVPPRASAYDDPVFSYETWNAPSIKINQADNNIFRLSQKIPFPGKRTLAGRIAERDADVARGDADAVALEVRASVTRSYYDLWQAQQNVLVYAREKELLQRLAHVAEQRYGAGEGSQPDVLDAQMELTRVTNRLTAQSLAVESAAAALNTILSRAPDAPVGTPIDEPHPALDATSDALTALALEQRPELAAQAAAVAREETAVRLAHRDYYPDFEFNLGRFINNGQRDGYGGMVSVSIPLAYKGKYDAGVGEANAKLSAAQAERRRVEDLIRGEVRQAFLRVRSALLVHDLFVTTHLPQAEQALRVTESAYAAGSVDFLRLMESARTIEVTHLEHVEAAADFEKAYADLERAVGTTIPRAPAPRSPR